MKPERMWEQASNACEQGCTAVVVRYQHHTHAVRPVIDARIENGALVLVIEDDSWENRGPVGAADREVPEDDTWGLR